MAATVGLELPQMVPSQGSGIKRCFQHFSTRSQWRRPMLADEKILG